MSVVIKAIYHNYRIAYRKPHHSPSLSLNSTYRDPLNAIHRLYSHYTTVLKHSLLRTKQAYHHYQKMKSYYQTKQPTINTATKEHFNTPLTTLIYESNSIMTTSYYQIHRILTDSQSLLEIIKKNSNYNFSSTTTLNFFPKEILVYLTILSDLQATHIVSDKGKKKKKKKKTKKLKKLKKSHRDGGMEGESGNDDEGIHGSGSGGSDDDYSDGDDDALNHEKNQSEVFELTKSEEDQFGHLKEFILHSDSDDLPAPSASPPHPPNLLDDYERQLLENQILFDDEYNGEGEGEGGGEGEEDLIYDIDMSEDSDKETSSVNKKIIASEVNKKQTRAQFSAHSKGKKTKSKKKTLQRWNPDPCSECDRSFRGEGKISSSHSRTQTLILLIFRKNYSNLVTFYFSSCCYRYY